MEQSPRLSLSYVMPAQAQKHVTVNETFRRLDALTQLSVLSRATAAEPASPAEGDAYILPASPTGAAWGAYSENNITVFQDSAWIEIAAVEGLRAWVNDESALAAFNGAGWSVVTGGGSSETAAKFGVNATADATNKLSVKSNAVLFDALDAGEGGNGDSQVKVNKEAVGDTASHLFQTGFSGRAEFGLTGDDDFHVKVSANGSSWTDALIVDKDSGYVGFSGEATPEFPVDITAGATASTTINGRTINPAGVQAATTSGRSGFLLTNDNNFVPDGSSHNSIFQFHFPFDGGNDAFKVFRIARGATLSDVFWVNMGGGAVFGSPTGGDKGAGAVNAEAVYDDNALLSCYVFDQYLDGDINLAKWDARVPDRRRPDRYEPERDKDGNVVEDPDTKSPVMWKVSEGEIVNIRTHEPLRKFAARMGTAYDPLTLDGYAKHWKEKRHLTAMPNEASFDPDDGLAAGEWIQRLVETVEIQAVLIEQANQRLKALERRKPKPAGT